MSRVRMLDVVAVSIILLDLLEADLAARDCPIFAVSLFQDYCPILSVK